VLFGGWSTQAGFLADTWEWDGLRWKRVDAFGPSARGGKPGMAYDSSGHRILLYGGWGAQENGPLSDMWAFDGEAWTAVHIDRRSAAGYLGESLFTTMPHTYAFEEASFRGGPC
jgi:hypothetical protein